MSDCTVNIEAIEAIESMTCWRAEIGTVKPFLPKMSAT